MNSSAYFSGLMIFYFASLIFTAFDWIEVNREKTAQRLLVPLVVAAVFWTIFFFAGTPILALTVVGGYVGGAIVLWIIPYVLFKVCGLILLPSTTDFVDDEILLLVMGGVYAVIYFGVRLAYDQRFRDFLLLPAEATK